MFKKILNWFGFCEHSYIVSTNYSTHYDTYTKKIKSGRVEFKSLHFIFHMTCFHCGKGQEIEIVINDVGSNSQHKDYLDIAKMRLSLKYKIRNKF